MPCPSITLMLSLMVLACSAQTAQKVTSSQKAAAKAQPATVGEDWPVWGGKKRNFLANSTGLADSWPTTGPKKLWSRSLGDGYSAIAEEVGILSIDKTPEGIALKFSEKARISPEKLAGFVSSHAGAVFTPAGVLRLNVSDDEQDSVLDVARGVLLELRASD